MKPNPSGRLTILSAIRPLPLFALLVTLATVWWLMLLHQSRSVDHALFDILYAPGPPWMVDVARHITDIGNFPGLILVAAFAALVLAFQWRSVAAILVLAIPISDKVLVHAMKAHFALGRPPEDLHLAPTIGYAFPSGHSADSMATYLTAALLLASGTKWWPVTVAPALLIVLMIGLTRVMLGAHWPADVIGGWAFGAFWAIAWLRVADVLYMRASSRRRMAMA